MKILVIPEDFRKDQYILKPIITAMMAKLGKPRTKVMVCQDPLLGGITLTLPSLKAWGFFIHRPNLLIQDLSSMSRGRIS